MNIELELHNLKRKVLNGKHISDQFKKEIADKIFQIEKEVAISYTRCCTELPTKYSISFAGFVAANVEVQGNKIKVLDSMNGWGDKIPSKSISIIKK